MMELPLPLVHAGRSNCMPSVTV